VPVLEGLYFEASFTALTLYFKRNNLHFYRALKMCLLLFDLNCDAKSKHKEIVYIEIAVFIGQKIDSMRLNQGVLK
jgi:hypothetical protein